MDITEAIAEIIGNKCEQDGGRYGIRAKLESEDPAIIALTLTFLKDSVYCCFESGCHVGAMCPAWWCELRKRLERFGIVDLPFPVTVRLFGIVEHGARMTALGDAFAINNAKYTYTAVFVERA